MRRRVRFEIPLAFAWSSDVRGGLRAADKGDWETAMRRWTRATSASNATTRRAAQFNLFVAHEVAGRLEEARAHLMASEKELPAPVGYTSRTLGQEPEGRRVVTPNDFQSHLWRLEQHEIIKRCAAGSALRWAVKVEVGVNEQELLNVSKVALGGARSEPAALAS